jgi:hypothetical protein
MRIHKLLVEAVCPNVDISSSEGELPTSSSKGTVSSTSKRTFPKSFPSKSKPLINLSAFTSNRNLDVLPLIGVTLQSWK